LSEHKSNVRAQMAGAGGRQLSVELLAAFAAKPNILILPADRIRPGPDGQVEVLTVPPVKNEDGTWSPGQGEPSWTTPSPETVVVPDGGTLGVDKLDFVVNLVATAVGGMVSPDGRVVGRRRHLRELFREDAQHFLGTLGQGPQPS
jgi:hypothetical protein